MPKHILVVDDEEDIREVLSQVLAGKGYRVTAARSGDEALRVAKSDPADLVISDLQMEDADGLELVEQIKLILPNVPFILLTGMIFDAEVVRKTIHKKVSAYIEKTAPLERVTTEVQRLLGDLQAAAPAK